MLREHAALLGVGLASGLAAANPIGLGLMAGFALMMVLATTPS